MLNSMALPDFANCDHVASAEAISKGLLARTAETPAYWIHTSGTGILTYIDIERNVYGESYDHVFNDWDDIGQVTSIPDAAIHRNVDKIVLSAGDHPDKVKTAIVCPPTIYGPGRGPDNQRSLQAYNLSKITLQRKKAFQVGSGKNLWTQVHVQDLSDLYLLLGEAAIEGGGKATWGKDGYYFAENGEFEWGSMSKAIAKAAHNKGLIQSEEVDSLDPKEVDELLKYGQVMWGTNSRGQSTRGKKLLGWAPSRRSLADEIPDIVDGEAKSLGLVQGHASKVTS